ncbi:PPR repeat family domain-containing protein [Phthorimaea operculella]|nr:PPR repeat family domain-containing protein [Phthorimaea operculella]
MAFRSITFIRMLKNVNLIRNNAMSTSMVLPKVNKINTLKEFKTEDKLVYPEDPDKFGSLSGRQASQSDALEDEGDIKEEEFLGKQPLPSQQFTTRQYADIIKQYLKHKRLKEAIDVLETRMLKEDKVKPENYIYNILIGACADVGYTKKAFKLYNEMKRRGLKPTGDTFTCLFEACSNSPWAADGLKNAKNLRNFMIEKGIEPNLTNYNAMIKAYGRCGDLPTAFGIADEMTSKKIKIRVHTFNHLLHACISDKDSGLRHALVVWRKMLKSREKPNIYSFNLMLRCVKECNLGSKEDIEELIRIIQMETPMAIETKPQILQIKSAKEMLGAPEYEEIKSLEKNSMTKSKEMDNSKIELKQNDNEVNKQTDNEIADSQKENNAKTLTTINKNDITFEIVEKLPAVQLDDRRVPNLLSKKIKMHQVLSLQEVDTVQDKFAIVGGQDDFLKEMESYSIKPDVKTVTQMLALLDDNLEAENKLLATVKSIGIKTDIDFYNMLIKKRCFRGDYENAMAVKKFLEKEEKFRKRRYPNDKKLWLKPNVMTYGVLALACNTKESAEKLLNEMKEKQIKTNIHILGTLLRQGTANNQFGYVVYIMNFLKDENIQVNDIFLKHLEAFNDKCVNFLAQVDENGTPISTQGFEKAYKRFSSFYTKWLKDIDVSEALEPEHPWQQFRENYPETVQRLNIDIKEPKKFYKRDRRYTPYTPKLL